MELPLRFSENRRLEHLVENRTVYTANSAELNIYETHHFAEEVILQFNQPVFASMIEGKKIMHLREDSFEFLPEESLIMPANELMKIDFPEAKMDNPTKCLAMTISPEKISQIVMNMNDLMPKTEQQEWKLGDFNFAFTNNKAVSSIIQRIIYLFIENHESKDIFIDSMLKELIVRVLQKQNRDHLEEKSLQLKTAKRMAFIVEHIKNHLPEPLTISQLSGMACMSESNFYKVFKNELGVSPVQYINHHRIRKAMAMLRLPGGMRVKEVYLACGFNNFSYFVRTFKKMLQMTPSAYMRKSMAKSI